MSSLGFAFAHRARPGLHLGTGAASAASTSRPERSRASIAAHWVYNVLLLWLSGRGRGSELAERGRA